MACFDNKPKKVEQVQTPPIVNSLNKSQSAWNQAGTWEDKALKRDLIEKIIGEGLALKLSLQGSIVKVIRGEASLVTVRGKRKLGYDLDLDLTLSIDGTNV